MCCIQPGLLHLEHAVEEHLCSSARLLKQLQSCAKKVLLLKATQWKAQALASALKHDHVTRTAPEDRVSHNRRLCNSNAFGVWPLASTAAETDAALTRLPKQVTEVTCQF